MASWKQVPPLSEPGPPVGQLGLENWVKLFTVPSGSVDCTAIVVEAVAPPADAVMVMVAGFGTVFGAMKSPVFWSIIPPVAVQLRLGLIPLTLAVYCQFAPTPMVAGAAAMLMVSFWPTLLDEPPHAASGRSARKMMAR